MALTLAEAAKLSNDVVLQGVIETVVKESPVLDRLPFIEIAGNALTYNRENAMASAAWFAVGDTWVESTPTFTQVQTSLGILGGDADVDQYISTTRSNVQDIEAAVLELKAKALAHEFEDKFVYGDGTANTPAGVHSLIGAGAQQVNQGSGTTPAALSLSNLDSMLDLIKPGRPDFLVCSRRTRRGLSKYMRSLNSPVYFEPDEFGRRLMFYDGVPVLVSDFVVDTEAIASGRFSAKTGGASTSIFAVKVGEGGGVAGLSNGGIQVENIGSLETKDARRWRCKWYVTLALFATLGLARIDGISSADVVT